MVEQLTRDYLRNLHVDREEHERKRNIIIKREINNTLEQIKRLAERRRTSYTVNTIPYHLKPDIIQDIYKGLLLHLPDSTITVDTLGNGIHINWS